MTDFPPLTRADIRVALVVEWAALHADELLTDWELAQAGLPLRRIVPLR